MSYDFSQYCMNGHKTNKGANNFPNDNKEYCPACGAKTITHCPNCNTPIREEYILRAPPPRFCEKCGSPFPWTESKIVAVKELAQEFGIKDDDLEKISTSMNDLMANTPKTDLAAIRFKKIMSSLGPVAYDMSIKILTDVLSETAKKILFPTK
jgi:hypothetical protein